MLIKTGCFSAYVENHTFAYIGLEHDPIRIQ